MSISEETLLTKMTEELELAKSAQQKEIQLQHLHTLKVLVELSLADEKTASPSSKKNGESKKASDDILANPTITTDSKIDINDGANGNSLFDF